VLVVYASPLWWTNLEGAQVWRLARWGTDECIEYLLNAHPERCKAVMRRVQADNGRGRIGGLPELWQIALDGMAEDETLVDVETALDGELDEVLPEEPQKLAAGVWSFARVCHPERENRIPLLNECEGVSERACVLLRHEFPRLLLAARYVAGELRSPREPDFL